VVQERGNGVQLWLLQIFTPLDQLFTAVLALKCFYVSKPE